MPPDAGKTPAVVPPAAPPKEAAAPPDQATITAAVASLAEQEKDKWARVGYEQGYKQGGNRPKRDCRPAPGDRARLKEAELCLREARQRSREIIAASEVKVVELAVAAAERLLQTQLELAPDKVIQIVREAMRLMAGGEKVTVFVSPADLGACLGMQERIKKEFTGVNRLEFLPDGDLARGSCRIESENGTVEYLLHEESRRLKELLLDLARREKVKWLRRKDWLMASISLEVDHANISPPSLLSREGA